MEGQRLGALRVSGELMRDHLFRATAPGVWVRTESGIPADAEFVRCYVDDARNEFVFIYRHPSFRLVPPGGIVPNLDAPQMSQLHLTVPLHPDTSQVLERLIAGQVERERQEAATTEAVAKSRWEKFSDFILPGGTPPDDTPHPVAPEQAAPSFTFAPCPTCGKMVGDVMNCTHGQG